MATETTPLRGVQYASDAQRRKRIVGITGVVVVLAAVVVVLWLTLSGHGSNSMDPKMPRAPENSSPVDPRDEAPDAAPAAAPGAHLRHEPPVDAVHQGTPPVDAVHHGQSP
ncbi:unnamed protein product [Hyaloperonospora brassicae]|uniref:RxLR effector candidate protein n=1 Tax=Hyaloperonospora brassicae TaxID=162125 RepID=A0AAV0U5N9_HYABA|nr:unnamed protein product [Hyaloperonospora brassicae]